MEFPYDKKMKKLFKTIFLSLFVAFTLCLSLGTYVFATENEAEAGDSEGEAQTEQTSETAPASEVYSPCLHITVQYSAGMAIQDGDIFRIHYRLLGTTEDAIIELDASQLAGATGKLDMNVGSYSITGCEYTGTNADILSQGYALNESFNITDNATDYAQLRLYIGTESATLLNKEYGGVVGFTGTNEPYQFPENESVSTEATSETVTTEQPDTQAGIDAPDTNSSTEEQATEEATTEEEKPEPQSFSARPLIPVMIIAIIGALVILWARKSGKI